jgi:Lrp/AsnC family transcriptional regulator, leucine-responsive regulatory protein
MDGRPTRHVNSRPPVPSDARPAAPDPVDLTLLKLLREDGRAPVAELAAAAHVSRATAYLRLDRLRRSGVIEGFTARVNPDRVGMPLTAMVLLSAGPHVNLDRHGLRARIARMPQVEYAAFITGEQDVFLVVRLSDQEEFRRFVLEELPTLPGVRSTFTSLVLDEIVHRPYLLPGDASQSTGAVSDADAAGWQ